MAFHFPKSTYPILLVLLVCLSGCYNPPAEPIVEEKEFDLRELPWEEVSMPTDLPGNWYRETETYLGVAGDSLYMRGFWTPLHSIEKSGSYYKLIYRIENFFFTIYLRNLTKDNVDLIYTIGWAEDEEKASVLVAVEPWYTLNSTSPWLWIPTDMPEVMAGNWHIRSGEMEMVIDRGRVVVDGEDWEIDSVQTNQKQKRLILRSGERYKSFYFREYGLYSMEGLLVDGKEDIQDINGIVRGKWATFRRWWDVIETFFLYPGSRWVYDCAYSESYTRLDKDVSPIDSIFQTNDLTGRLELEVTSSTVQGGTGSLSLQASFLIDEEKGRYYHSRRNGALEVVTDSSWDNTDIIETEQYDLSLENDTLWFDTEEGKAFFISAKVHQGASVNLRPFVYPSGFPRGGFPEGGDALGQIEFPRPSTTALSAYTRTAGKVFFYRGTGFQAIYYKHHDSEAVYWFGELEALNPYITQIFFECNLVDFSPGQ